MNMELSGYELKIAQAAVAEYRRIMDRRAFIEKLLETKKFKMNSYVAMEGANYLDAMFGIGEGLVGKVIGYDTDGDYYRLYYSEANPYVGVKEERLQAYEGEPPAVLLNYDPNMLSNIIVNMKSSIETPKKNLYVNSKTYDAVKEVLGVEADKLTVNNNIPIGKVVVVVSDKPVIYRVE